MHLLLSTIALRPYVFVFLAVYLFVSIVNFGFRTTAIFTVITYAVALACEWSSVHNGFPFGLYHYIPATVGREIWVFGVPFMDSLSFTFLSFASYTVALLIASPIEWRELRSETARHQGNPPLAAGLDHGRDVHGYDRPGDRSTLRVRRSLVPGQDFLVRPAGAAFRRTDQQLPRVVFCRGSVSGAVPVPRRPARARQEQTYRCAAAAAAAMVARSGPLPRNRRLRNHDGVRNQCADDSMGRDFYLPALCRVDREHADSPGRSQPRPVKSRAISKISPSTPARPRPARAAPLPGAAGLRED